MALLRSMRPRKPTRPDQPVVVDNKPGAADVARWKKFIAETGIKVD